MNYNEMLNKILKESGKMHKDIAEECSKYGIKLTNTYLSSLKTNPGKVASDDISRAIAKACGAKYEDILVVQAYLDKAPKIIIEYLEHTKSQFNTTKTLLSMYQTNKSPNESENITLMSMNMILDEIGSMSLAEFICKTIEEQRNQNDTEILDMIKKAQAETEEPKYIIMPTEIIKKATIVTESKIKDLIE